MARLCSDVAGWRLGPTLAWSAFQDPHPPRQGEIWTARGIAGRRSMRTPRCGSSMCDTCIDGRIISAQRAGLRRRGHADFDVEAGRV